MEFTRHLIDANPDLIYIKNQQGTIILANTAFAQRHQIDLEDLQKNGKLENDFSFERDLEVLQNNQSIRFEEFYNINKDNKAWYQTTKKTFTSEDGNRYLLSISSDISSSKKYQQIADNLLQAQDLFLSSVSSELEASGKAITGMGRLLRNSPLTKEQEKYLDSILSIADHLVEAPSISLLRNTLETEKLKTEQAPCREALTEIENDFNKLESIKVLLVEDDLSCIFSTSRLLKSWGVETDVAYAGEQALKLASEKKYDIIFMDLLMQGKDGFECTNLLKQTPNLNQATPIIAFTADKSAFEVKSYRLAGFEDYLYKPYDEADLYLMISRNASRELKADAPKKSEQPWKNHPLYDFSGLGSLVDDMEFVHKMQQLFINTVPQQLASLTAAIEATNWDNIVHIAHRLKSVFANIKVEEATAALKVIEHNASKALQLPENIKQLQILHEVTEVIISDFTIQLQAHSNL